MENFLAVDLHGIPPVPPRNPGISHRVVPFTQGKPVSVTILRFADVLQPCIKGEGRRAQGD